MLAVILNGGLVAGVVTNNPTSDPHDIMVIDYDVQGIADDDIIMVPQGTPDEKHHPAVVRIEQVTRSVVSLFDVAQLVQEKLDVEQCKKVTWYVEPTLKKDKLEMVYLLEVLDRTHKNTTFCRVKCIDGKKDEYTIWVRNEELNEEIMD